jgi:alanine dehydrogenase
VLLIGNDVTADVLRMPDVLDVLDRSYRGLADGTTLCRPRIDLRFPTGTGDQAYQWGTMEGGSSASGYYAIRMKSDVLTEVEHGGNRTQEKHCVRPGTYFGMVLLLSTRTGEPLALLNDGVLQHMRVGADSAIGTRLAARDDSRVLGLLGSGGMARTHLAALQVAQPVERVQVYSPTRAHRERFAAEAAEQYGIEAVAVDEPRAAFRGADVVMGCTDSASEVMIGDWLEPGMHVTSIGGKPDARARERYDVWLRLGTCPSPLNDPSWRPTDEFLAYRAEPDHPVWRHHTHGRIRRPPSDVRQVSYEEVLRGEPVRTSPGQITFSERGNVQGAQFFAVAGLVYELAVERGLGREIPTEWFLQDIRD